jgi:lysozyme family protein
VADFNIAVKLVLVHEGGYTPGLPGDPGGETNFGIAKRWHPNLDIKNLTPEQASAIYHKEYWSFDDVADQQLANCALDCAVNQGQAVAKQFLVSFKTLREFQLARLLRYASLGKTQFNHSWFERTLDV